MSDNANAVQDCCVCYEPVKNMAVISCIRLKPLCEACYQKIPSCPLCRTPFDNGVQPLEIPDDDLDINEANLTMLVAAEAGYEDIVRLMQNRMN